MPSNSGKAGTDYGLRFAFSLFRKNSKMTNQKRHLRFTREQSSVGPSICAAGVYKRTPHVLLLRSYPLRSFFTGYLIKSDSRMLDLETTQKSSSTSGREKKRI